VITDEDGEDGLQLVLALHQKKNRTIKPPDSQMLQSHMQTGVDK